MCAVALLALACQERKTTTSAGGAGSPGASGPGAAAASGASGPGMGGPGASGLGASAPSAPGSGAAASGAEARPDEPSPSASASASAQGGAGGPGLPGFMVGRFSGKGTTYAAVVEDRQTYSQHSAEIVIGNGGQFTARLARGQEGQPASYRCEAGGTLRPEGALYRMEIVTSTCRLAKAGSTVEFSLEKVGKCVVVWSRKKGFSPFEIDQVAMHREGC